MTTSAPHRLDFGREAICFAIERTSRRKTVAISIGHDGVRVLAPSDLDDACVMAIVRRKGAWLLRKRAMYQELGEAIAAPEFVSGETFYYLGRPYRLRVVSEANAVLSRITARGSSFVVPVQTNASPSIQRAAVRGAMLHWYRDHAKFHFASRATAISRLLSIEEPTLRVVDQSKRWGSCDAGGCIRLNWRLVMAPMTLVDYVIAHEACHVLERSHSRRFWRSLETIMPDYERRARELNFLAPRFMW
jgi:predicted metal-dependent hydrolase